MFFLFSCFHNLLPLDKCQAILLDEAAVRVLYTIGAVTSDILGDEPRK